MPVSLLMALIPRVYEDQWWGIYRAAPNAAQSSIIGWTK
jgi:hypothetical protein